MTKEEKQLLLVDLCGRLPYGVKIQCINSDNETVIEELFTIGIEEDSFDCNLIEYVSVKPYLVPMSSMTKEQGKTYHELIGGMFGTSALINFEILEEFFNKNHIDYRSLIPKGLAIDCTNLNIY